LGSVTFIIGLKMLSHPDSARKGNLVAAFGMTIAIFATIFLYKDADGNLLGNYAWIFSGLIIGTIVGTLAAKKVQMTAMPEMVSLFNGMGGACAMLISIIEFKHLTHAAEAAAMEVPAGIFATLPMGMFITIVLGMVIGSVSFAGSIIAWGKLNGKIKDRSFNGQHIVNIILLLIVAALTAYMVA